MSLTAQIVVGGRFHSEYLVEALSSLGYQTSLLTSLPKGRFRSSVLPSVQSLPIAEIVFRGLGLCGAPDVGDFLKMRLLGHWAATKLRLSLDQTDLLIGWSSFCLEALRTRRAGYQVVIRDSSHIDFQTSVLKDEYERHGLRHASREFCRQRELEEYELADKLLVLSDFAKRTFIEHGVAPEKIDLLRIGVDTQLFHPQLIPNENSDRPMEVVFFGTVGFRKGVAYLLDAFSKISPESCRLTLIGPVEREFLSVMERFPHFRHLGPISQSKAAELLPQFDVCVLPSIDDGFGQTLIQAMACGLIPVGSRWCGASEAIGESGLCIDPQSEGAIRLAMEQLLDLRSEWGLLKQRARDIALQWEWANYKPQIQKLSHSWQIDQLTGEGQAAFA